MSQAETVLFHQRSAYHAQQQPRRTRAQHLATFFASYPDFEHDPSSPVSNEFNRLVKSHRWKRGSWQRENAWRGYSEAMGMQFASFYGTSEDDMNAWHALCAALRVDPAPDTINECKEARAIVALLICAHAYSISTQIIKSTHVNLVDFIDTPVTGNI
ncbi:hypothetical protein APHAL10511_007626 [Amanita phalloides]|nr:hypothetical protein APHAL10511_007626 [Amanita phalloides]